MSYMTNCPNCGAPINGDVCEYCGTDLSRLQNKSNVYTLASNGWRPANVYIFHDDLKKSYEHLSGNGEINRIGDLFIQV